MKNVNMNKLSGMLVVIDPFHIDDATWDYLYEKFIQKNTMIDFEQ